jgi:hypothetical protein
MIFVGVLFIFFTTTIAVIGSQTWFSLGIMLITVPPVIVITAWNIKMTRFCDRCGATLTNPIWSSPMRFCSKCGANLDDKPKGVDDKPKRFFDLLE